MMSRFTIIGVIHLLPLPGTPRGQSFKEVLDRALFDAKQLELEGVTSVIIENFGDAPFVNGQVEPHIVAMMTRIAVCIGEQCNLKLGINVLRNDARSALAIASACQAEFVRINIHTGAAWTDQGLIQGDAYQTLMYRKQIEASVRIAADVFVKHASPAGSFSLIDVAKDTLLRGLADYLIVTGVATGSSANLETVKELRIALPTTPIWIGSGLNPENVAKYITFADAGIVGSYFHRDGNLAAPLSRDRIALFIKTVASNI